MLKGWAARPPMATGLRARHGGWLAALLAVLAGILVFAAVQGGRPPASAPEAASALAPVVTAAQDIPAGTRITPGMLTLHNVSPADRLTGAYTALDAAAGRYARLPLFRGEQVVDGKLTTAAESPDGLSRIVSAGLRAMAVEVDRVVGAGGLLRPGDRVDVIAVVRTSTLGAAETVGGLAEGERALTIAQNVEVLAVEQALKNVPLETDASTDGTLTDQPAADPDGAVATLAVTPAQAQMILLAETSGAIRLAVRAPGDTALAPLAPGRFDTDAAFQAGPQPVDTSTSVTLLVPAGRRAMAVAVNKVVGVGGLLRPGDRVDVIGVLPHDPQSGLLARSMTLARDVLVLAVEQQLEYTGVAAADGRTPQPGVQPFATVATLALTPGEAQEIALVEVEGALRLSVREPDDRSLPYLGTTTTSNVDE